VGGRFLARKEAIMERLVKAGATYTIGLMIMLILILSAGIPVRALAADTIKIGELDPFSGTFESLGRTFNTGVRFAVDEQNAKGGLLGRKIEILTEDDEGKPDVATRKAKKLIMENKVNFITSGFGSHIAIALNKVATAQKTLYINYAAMSDPVQGAEFSPYAFRVCQNVHSSQTAMILLMATKPYRKLYCIYPDYASGHDNDKVNREQLKIHVPDAKILGTDFPPLGNKDYGPYITKIIASKADAVLSGLFSTDLINFVKQARAMGLKAPFPIFSPLSKHPYIINELKEDGVGLYWSMGYSLRVKTPENEELIKRFHEVHKNDKDFLTQWPFADCALAILGWKMTFAAIEKAGSLDPEKIIGTFENFQWKSPVGQWTMRKCDHQLILPIYGGAIESGPNPFYSFPWSGTNITEFPAEKVAIPATADYNARCR
jgi:branched-chain amino acid transport system substrate-binding protein